MTMRKWRHSRLKQATTAALGFINFPLYFDAVGIRSTARQRTELIGRAKRSLKTHSMNTKNWTFNHDPHKKFNERVNKCKTFALYPFGLARRIDEDEAEYRGSQILGVNYRDQTVLLRQDHEWHDIDDLILVASLDED